MIINFLKTKINNQFLQLKEGGIKLFFKKILILISYLSQIPFYIFAIFNLLIIHILSPIFLIRIGRLRSAKLGHLSEEYEIFICEKKLGINQPTKKFIDIFFREKSICNKYYYKLRKKDFIVLPRIIIYPLYNLFILLYKKKKFICDREHAAMDTFHSLDKTNSTIQISEDLKKQSYKTLEKIGLKKNQKIICLHLRDSSYRGPNNSTDFRNIKNVDRYVKGIDYLTKKGYFVIRTGVITKNRLNFNSSNYFDYSKSDIKSEKLDVFLASTCFFCIANGSGFEPMVRSFRNPVLYTNFNKYGLYKSQHEKDMTIFIHYKDLNTHKKLSLREIYERKLFNIYSDSEIDQKNIFLEENSEDEILDSIIEMIDRIEGRWKVSDDVKDLNLKFKNFYSTNIRLENGFNPFINIKSQIPSSFLRRNNHLID